jgi:uridine kinase
MIKPKVIAVSGASGSGKTTMVKLLAQRLNCPALFFDDYADNNTYPGNQIRTHNISL